MAAPALDRFIAAPRLHEIDHVDVGAPSERAWAVARHLDMGRSPLARALFSLRTLPDRFTGTSTHAPALRIDDFANAAAGFRILDERPGFSVTVGAIGKVWQPDIDFADVPPQRYAGFDDPGWVKVAWELRCEPRGTAVTRIAVELRVTATDHASWRRFQRYFAIVGPFSHFIRRHMLGMLARELGGAHAAEHVQPLPGDVLLPDAAGQATDGVTIRARPADIWPWLVQMGCRRAGWYSWDGLDNAGVPSAREIIPEFQNIRVGDILPGTPKGTDGFEVLNVDPPRALILGGLYNLDAARQMPFSAPRPAHYYQVTWAFCLEAIDETTTRLHVRARVAFGPGKLPARQYLMTLMHHFMQTRQLRNLRDRVQGVPATVTLY